MLESTRDKKRSDCDIVNVQETKNSYFSLDLNNSDRVTKVEIEYYTIERDKKDKEYVCYHMECSGGDSKWKVRKRFNECYKMNGVLISRFRTILRTNGIRTLPSFPRKMLFGNKNPVKIDDRRLALNLWLNSWIEICRKISREDARPIQSMIEEFLVAQSDFSGGELTQ